MARVKQAIAEHGINSAAAPPDDDFMVELRAVFDDAVAHVVDFDNPVTGGVSSNSVYVARSRG